jgi:preprotein translocase subunit SecD
MDGKLVCKKAHKLVRNLLAASCSHSGLDLSGSLNTQHSIRKTEIESSSTQKRKQINRRNLKLGVQKVQGDKHCSYYQLGAVKSVAGAKMETYRVEASTPRVCEWGVREREREREGGREIKAETCELGSVKKERGE